MKYKAYIKQGGGGCDYTIGCGRTVISIEASSMDEAKVKLAQEIEENYAHDETLLETAELYEINEIFVCDLNDIYKRINDVREAREQTRKEDAERKEFERLKAKFDGN